MSSILFLCYFEHNYNVHPGIGTHPSIRAKLTSAIAPTVTHKKNSAYFRHSNGILSICAYSTIIGGINRNSALQRNASNRSPCRKLHQALVTPHIGHGNPVSS